MTNENPQHIAIILDGNRRFAKRLVLEPWKGHEYGRDKVRKMLNYAKELGIKELTFYALSCENIKSRPKNELEFLYKLFRETFKEIGKEELVKNQIKIRFIGNLNLLPEDLKQQCIKLEEQTKNYKGYTVNLAIAYGGKQEITEAVRKILRNKISSEQITEEIIENNLYMKDQPDLIIRTGGEKRTSNFLSWQSAYSEWFFLDKFWPEFEKEDLINCIEEFKQRKRRFGA
ncbi:di-trans,poly-cis-decaprenylcistransferase [Candidatus Pacearchaeota archaeon]|nr:di-trans,poly-cis-decaprenylcistransferase [Candidatus Pacearchaeota archaeon]MBD3283164.1 di-trans,poly-cis-decaprenylcistransferase [Candidatus Pacearchaeota archaeon]